MSTNKLKDAKNKCVDLINNRPDTHGFHRGVVNILNDLLDYDAESCRLERIVIPPPNSFLNIDCMELMKKCPDGYFDLAIVDPPYGKNVDNGKKGNFVMTKHKVKSWDISPPGQSYFDELFRVSKNQIIWGSNYFNLPPTKCFFVWDKLNPIKGKFSDGELAWTSFEKASMIFPYAWIGFGRKFVEKDEPIHPAQKPIALYRKLLFEFAKVGDKILDTHVGSGSSLIACKELGFDYWGTEIDKDYYEAAKKRIARAFRQFDLNFNDEAAV